jgi:hypothetical protein
MWHWLCLASAYTYLNFVALEGNTKEAKTLVCFQTSTPSSHAADTDMDELGSLLEAAKMWATKAVIIDGIILSEPGQEEKVPTDICLHIGCNSNDATAMMQLIRNGM